MKIAVLSQDNSLDFEVPKEGPWVNFFSAFEKFGHQIVSMNQSPNIVIFMNNNPKLLKEVKRRIPRVYCVLVLWEPRVTRPANFIARDNNLYDVIFTPSKNWAKGPNVRLFNWPQCKSELWKFDINEWLTRSNTPVVFQGNKFSFVRGENYSLRREVINVFGENLKVFGHDWNSNQLIFRNFLKGLYSAIKSAKYIDWTIPKRIRVRVINYCGFSPEKSAELVKSKFVIVIENSSDYVSEKIFESISSGSLVLYVGPDLETFGIPSNIVVSCPNDASEILRIYLELIRNEQEAISVINNAIEFHNSQKFDSFFNEYVLAKLADDICREICGKRV